ncbi:hypothetical protein JAAARDRAFT_38834 [Jaapia argillacea MUCL 33604]|uniref:Uncharacterized protein n=1 Tax=Jaapia argillacea MUCL 33604 TaxID=933084 RepID=A0A067PU61_9AGAM|nr:hypothetical protein JAAARDRAFT_38834 [Jaapia argillacea MUCL 33604]
MSQNGTEQQTQAPTPPAHDDYPEQKHAGAVGYGPNYQRGVVRTLSYRCFVLISHVILPPGLRREIRRNEGRDQGEDPS